jgi:hypothetical protein
MTIRWEDVGPANNPRSVCWEPVMHNSTIRTADRLTHIKIVAVALVAGIAVIGVGIAARQRPVDMSAQLEARAPVFKAGQPVIWSGNEARTIR